jgi:hypothetical protein
MAHKALLLSVPVTVFIVVALVVSGFTFGQCYLAFNQMTFPIQGGAHTGMALLVNTVFELFKLSVVE